jgi:hypothetical protein
LTIALPAGTHVLELAGNAANRELRAAVVAGGTASYYVELGSAGPASAVGRLEVVSDPPGAQVVVDGVRRGAAPIDLADVAAGQHRVAITQNGATINRTVTVVAGSKASVVASTIGAGAAAGWAAITAPFEMKVLERGSQIGTTASHIMMPVGVHRLDLVNTELDLTTTLTVTVTAGATTTTAVPVPNGLLSVNALPWAEVLIDGKAAGTTPLGNLSVPVGVHDIVWRHPQLGERRRTVVVKANSPARVAVDFHQ